MSYLHDRRARVCSPRKRAGWDRMEHFGTRGTRFGRTTGPAPRGGPARLSLRRLDPAPQDLGDAPGLGDAAARGVGGLGVEDLADRAKAGLAHVGGEAVEEPAGGGAVVGVDP